MHPAHDPSQISKKNYYWSRILSVPDGSTHTGVYPGRGSIPAGVKSHHDWDHGPSISSSHRSSSHVLLIIEVFTVLHPSATVLICNASVHGDPVDCHHAEGCISRAWVVRCLAQPMEHNTTIIGIIRVISGPPVLTEPWDGGNHHRGLRLSHRLN